MQWALARWTAPSVRGRPPPKRIERLMSKLHGGDGSPGAWVPSWRRRQLAGEAVGEAAAAGGVPRPLGPGDAAAPPGRRSSSRPSSATDRRGSHRSPSARSRSASRSRTGAASSLHSLRRSLSAALTALASPPPLPDSARACLRDPRNVLSDTADLALASRLGYTRVWAARGLLSSGGHEVAKSAIAAHREGRGASKGVAHEEGALRGLGAVAEEREASGEATVGQGRADGEGGQAPPATPPLRTGDRAMGWEELTTLVREGSEASLGRLVRTEECTQRYRRARAEALESFATVSDRVLSRQLGFGVAVDGATGKLVAVVDGDGGALAGALRALDGGRYCESLRGVRVAWSENEFPYAFECGVEHHCIWCTRPLTEAEVAAVVAAERAGMEAVHWVNPPSLQSVRAVWHAHVASRAGPGAGDEGPS